MRSSHLALLAAVAAVAGSASADFSLNQPIYAQDEAAPRKPLMALLDKAGMAKPFEDAGINVYGLVEGSITYNFGDPEDHQNQGRSFDTKDQDPTFNQLYLAVEKTTDYAKAWDIGGKMAWTYGADASQIHSNGLFDHETPPNQIDLTELYGEVVLPVGSGLKVKLGKFITPLGYEYVNPSLNQFYSHSYLFSIVPYSHTGFLASYALNDVWTLGGGISRGWDQSIDDNNDMIDFIGTIGYVKDDITAALSFTVGPELPDNDSDWRVAIDWWASAKLSKQWTAGVNADFVWEQDTAQSGGNSTVYGAAGYLSYEICEYASIGTRVEWFNDTNREAGYDNTFYEITLGATLTPFARNEIGQNLKIRPEFRLDFADKDAFNTNIVTFQGQEFAFPSDDWQATFAIEAYFTF